MAKRRSRSRGSRSGGALLFVVGLLVGAAVLYFFLGRSRPAPVPPEPESRVVPAKWETTSKPHSSERRAAVSDHVEPEARQAAAVTVSEPHSSGPVSGVRVALVIDDLGHTVEELRPLEGLGVPVSYSVLPYEDQTPEVVAELRRRKAEILLHLPMEPKNGEDPGPGALLKGMGDEELQERTVAALKAVPGAVGVNNHMGSLLSAEEGPMTVVLRLLARRGLFFLDSRTSADSVGYRVATRLGIPSAERQVFLDGDPTPDAIHTQFQRLLSMARSRGSAIAIGHPHPETLAALEREVPKAREEGYEFVPVSFLLNQAGDAQ